MVDAVVVPLVGAQPLGIRLPFGQRLGPGGLDAKQLRQFRRGLRHACHGRHDRPRDLRLTAEREMNVIVEQLPAHRRRRRQPPEDLSHVTEHDIAGRPGPGSPADRILGGRDGPPRHRVEVAGRQERLPGSSPVAARSLLGCQGKPSRGLRSLAQRHQPRFVAGGGADHCRNPNCPHGIEHLAQMRLQVAGRGGAQRGVGRNDRLAHHLLHE